MKFFTEKSLILLLLSCTILTTQRHRILADESATRISESTIVDNVNSSELSCSYEIMRTYGMRGNPTPSNNPHPHCPNLVHNCCTETDATTSFTYWSSDIKGKIERYYQIFLLGFKYLFGYTPEGYLLARRFSIEGNLQCKQAANDYLAMNLNPKVTQHIYSIVNVNLQKIADIRKGFYCSICDATVQTHFRDFFATTNLQNFAKLYFSKDFCLTLVEDTIEASFYISSYFQRYLNDITTLMSCRNEGIKPPQINLLNFNNEEVKHCFFFRNKFFFFFCQKYCNQFSMVKASPLFDGDVVGMREFVYFFFENRNKAFDYPHNNILTDGVAYEENFLMDYYGEVLRDTVWFRPNIGQTSFLDQMKTEVTAYSGINPIPATVDSKYPLNILSLARMSVVIVSVIGAIKILF